MVKRIIISRYDNINKYRTIEKSVNNACILIPNNIDITIDYIKNNIPFTINPNVLNNIKLDKLIILTHESFIKKHNIIFDIIKLQKNSINKIIMRMCKSLNKYDNFYMNVLLSLKINHFVIFYEEYKKCPSMFPSYII